MGMAHRKSIPALYLWTLTNNLQSQHRATKETLPREELKIDDAMPRQHAAKKAMARHGAPTADTSEPPQWMQSLLPFVGMALGGAMRPNLPSGPFETPQPVSRLQPAGSSRSQAVDPPSSGTKRAATAAAPSMADWLSSIDQDFTGRGRHNSQFSQYLPVFEANTIYDLTDMEDFTAEDLAKLLQCAIGIGTRLVKYAKEDMDKLTKSIKRVRQNWE